MNALGYEYQSYFARRYYGQRTADGKADGETESWVEMTLERLGLRFGSLTEAAQARVRSAQDAQPDADLKRMLTAKTLKEAMLMCGSGKDSDKK